MIVFPPLHSHFSSKTYLLGGGSTSFDTKKYGTSWKVTCILLIKIISQAFAFYSRFSHKFGSLLSNLSWHINLDLCRSICHAHNYTHVMFLPQTDFIPMIFFSQLLCFPFLSYSKSHHWILFFSHFPCNLHSGLQISFLYLHLSSLLSQRSK